MSTINELQLNLAGKLLITAIGAWLLGKAVNVTLRGSKQEVQTVVNTMLASRRFQNELSRPGATINSIVEKLNLKNASAQEFERILGIKFPL